MIMVNSLDNPYYASEAKGASEKAKELGYKTTILSHSEDVKKQNELIDTAIGKKSSGIVLIMQIQRPASRQLKKRKSWNSRHIDQP